MEQKLKEADPKPVSRKGLYIPLILAVLLFGLWYGYWLFASTIMREELDAWIEDARDQGAEVEMAGYAIRGFPFFLRAEIEAPSYQTPEGVKWSGERLMIDTPPFNPTSLTFSTVGTQNVRVHLEGTVEEWQFDAVTLRLRLGQNQMGLQADRFEARPVVADGRALVFDDLRVNVKIEPDEDGEEAARILLAAQGLDIMVQGASGQTSRIMRIDIAGAMDQYSRYQQTGSLAQWGAEGGTLTLDGVQLFLAGDEETMMETQAPMIGLTGRLGVDYQGYPSGQITLSLRDPQSLIEALVDWRLITSRDGQEGTKFLVPMAEAAGGTLSVPISLKNGEINILGQRVGTTMRLQ